MPTFMRGEWLWPACPDQRMDILRERLDLIISSARTDESTWDDRYVNGVLRLFNSWWLTFKTIEDAEESYRAGQDS